MTVLPLGLWRLHFTGRGVMISFAQKPLGYRHWVYLGL